MKEGDASESPAEASERRDGKRPAQEAGESEGNGHRGGSNEAQASGQPLSARLQASSRMVFQAMTGSTTTMPSITPESKAVAESSRSAGHLRRAREETSLPLLSSPRMAANAQTRGIGESVRMTAYPEGSSAAFCAFMNGPPLGHGTPEEEVGSQSQDARVAPTPPAATAQRSAVTLQEVTDGADVVQLLSLPGDPTADSGRLDGNDDALSPAEAARLREALFGGGGTGSRARWDRLLNFTPRGANDAADLQLLTGTADIPTAESVWLQQWDSVLAAYTDEVWGDLGPLAAEARHEVGLLSDQGQRMEETEPKSLARLRQILAHVRGGA